MSFNNEVVQTLVQTAMRHSDSLPPNASEHVEQCFQKAFISERTYVAQSATTPEQCFLASALRSLCMTNYMMDGVRSAMGALVLNGILREVGCVLLFVDQSALHRIVRAYRPTEHRKRVLISVQNRYGKIQIGVEQNTWSISVPALYRLCRASGKARTFPFFVI